MYHFAFDHSDFAQHLRGRGFKPYFNAWLDPEQQICTFPLWGFGPNPKLIGYQRYNWREVKIRNNGGKYFTWVADDYKDRACYGLDNCYGHGPLFVVEGIWDAIRVSNCYHDCVALLCNSPSRNLKAHIRQLAGERPIVALCDNDANKSGEKLAHLFDYAFYPPGNVKDVNDLSPEACEAWLTELKRRIQ